MRFNKYKDEIKSNPKTPRNLFIKQQPPRGGKISRLNRRPIKEKQKQTRPIKKKNIRNQHHFPRFKRKEEEEIVKINLRKGRVGHFRIAEAVYEEGSDFKVVEDECFL